MYKILVTGMTGQDAILFTDLALKKGDQIFGITLSDTSIFNDTYNDYFRIVQSTKHNYLTDFAKIIVSFNPDWIVNFMGITSSSLVNEWSNDVLQANLITPLSMMKTFFDINPHGKFFQPSSSYVFPTSNKSIDESSQKSPSSIYGSMKHLVDQVAEQYRKNGRFCINAYLFSHESFLRRNQSFTNKIFRKLKEHKSNNDFLLNDWNILNDWSSAKNVVDFVYSALSSNHNTDFVVGSGILTTVYDYTVSICNELGLFDPKLIVKGTECLDLNYRFSDSTKAKKLLNWKSNKSIDEVAISLYPELPNFMNDYPFGVLAQ